jgi:hypothetical protein
LTFAATQVGCPAGKAGERQRDETIQHWRVFLADLNDPAPELEWMAKEEIRRLGG